MPWENAYGGWAWTPDPYGSVNVPGSYRVEYGQQGSTASSPPTSGPNTADQSGSAILQAALNQLGLGSLAQWAKAKWDANESIDQIMLELRQTPEYQQRFPAMKQLMAAGHPISEQQYLDYEKSVTELMRSAGLPKGFYDQPDDFTNLLTNNVGLPELQSRLQSYQDAVFKSPPEVRQALQQYYGVSDGQLTAFFIDPDRAAPLIQREFNAAQAGGEAAATGFGSLSQAQAESLASRGLSEQQLQSGFNKLANLNQVIGGLPGQQAGVGTDTALQAEFAQNAQAQQRLEQAQAAQEAYFKAGGQVAASSKGALGAA